MQALEKKKVDKLFFFTKVFFFPVIYSFLFWSINLIKILLHWNIFVFNILDVFYNKCNLIIKYRRNHS